VGINVRVMGTGSFLPGDPIPFDQTEHYLGEITQANPQVMKWLDHMKLVMKEMLDIDFYHYAISSETGEIVEDNISMSVKAVRAALNYAKMNPNDIEMLIFAGSHVDQMPTISPRILEALGIEFGAEMTIHSNCTSPYKAFIIAHDMITYGRYKTVAVVSSNIASSGLRSDFYNQSVATREDLLLRWFLSDGAGCIILQGETGQTPGVYLRAAYTESAGYNWEPIMHDRKPAYSLSPKIIYEQGLHHIAQNYKFVIMGKDESHNIGRVFIDGLKRMVAKYSIDLARVRFFQLNLPTKHVFDLLKEDCGRLGISDGAYYTKLNKVGYCGPPMMLICLDKILREESLQPGNLILSFVTEVSKILQAGYLIEVI